MAVNVNGLRPGSCTRLRRGSGEPAFGRCRWTPAAGERTTVTDGWLLAPAAGGARPLAQPVQPRSAAGSTSKAAGRPPPRLALPSNSFLNPTDVPLMQPGVQGLRRGRLDPKLDIVFRMLFGAEQNRHLLLSLLNAVLQPAAPIELAEVQHAEPERLGVDDKSIALDVRVRLANGEQIDVEMQTQRHPALRERALYYWARLYVGQQQHGSAYADLRRCAVIWITNFNELPGQRFHSIFCLREVRDADPLTDHLEVHLLELPKLRDALDRNDEPSLVGWARFLTATADEELETLAMENPVLKEAKDALDRLSADPDARVRAEQREMALFSYELGLSRAHRDGIEKGLEEGIEQGVEQGRVQGKAEILQRLLTLKFGSLPADVAGRVASATDKELANWADRVLSASTLESVFDA